MTSPFEETKPAASTVIQDGDDFFLIFDIESSKMVLFDEPDELDEQPHIVQIAAIVVNKETNEIIQSIDLIVKPDGWSISDETIAVHGITNEYAAGIGIPEELALLIFMQLIEVCSTRYGYVVNFDNRMIRIALKRLNYGDDLIDKWNESACECVMALFRPIYNASKVSGEKKVPTLEEAVEFYSGHKPEKSHSAMPDVMSTFMVLRCINECKPGFANRNIAEESSVIIS